MIHRELHVDEIRIPNVERVGRGLVPGSETVRQGVTGPAEGKVHPGPFDFLSSLLLRASRSERKRPPK